MKKLSEIKPLPVLDTPIYRLYRLLLFTICALKPKENPKLKMNNFMQRFPHLMEQILQKLDNKGLAKSREIARSWQKIIDTRMYLWLRIVKIPTILNGGNTYLHLAARNGQIGQFRDILDIEADKNPVNENGFTPFLVACHSGCVKITEMLLKKYDELKVDLSRKDKCGSTAFHLACIGGRYELAELIMKNLDKLKIDIPYARHYNPRFVYFLPTF